MLFNDKKSVQSIAYFASREGGTIDKMKAIKLLWIADRYSLMNYGKMISGDTYYAMKNGPVPSITLDLIKGSTAHSTAPKEAFEYANSFFSLKPRGYDIKNNCQPDLDVFEESNFQSLVTAYENYGSREAGWLSEYSHNFPEWIEHKQSLKKVGRCKIDINQFFTPIKDDGSIFNMDPEFIEYNKEIFDFTVNFAKLLEKD